MAGTLSRFANWPSSLFTAFLARYSSLLRKPASQACFSSLLLKPAF
jgi:hypothetical protein